MKWKVDAKIIDRGRHSLPRKRKHVDIIVFNKYNSEKDIYKSIYKNLFSSIRKRFSKWDWLFCHPLSLGHSVTRSLSHLNDSSFKPSFPLSHPNSLLRFYFFPHGHSFHPSAHSVFSPANTRFPSFAHSFLSRGHSFFALCHPVDTRCCWWWLH